MSGKSLPASRVSTFVPYSLDGAVRTVNFPPRRAFMAFA